MKGRNYPLGIQTFENIIRGNYVYVDKTALAYQMVHENKYCFLNRPRRFGKSLLVTLLQAYFEGKQELFKGLAMQQLEHEWLAILLSIWISVRVSFTIWLPCTLH